MTQLLPPPFPAAGAVATLEKTELQKLRKMKFGLAFWRALRYNLLRTCRCVGIGRRGGFKIPFVCCYHIGRNPLIFQGKLTTEQEPDF